MLLVNAHCREMTIHWELRSPLHWSSQNVTSSTRGVNEAITPFDQFCFLGNEQPEVFTVFPSDCKCFQIDKKSTIMQNLHLLRLCVRIFVVWPVCLSVPYCGKCLQAQTNLQLAGLRSRGCDGGCGLST